MNRRRDCSPVEWISLDTVSRLPVHPKAAKYRMLGVAHEGDTNLSSIARNMAEYGFDETHPLVVFKGMLLDGRNRRAAAELAGLREVPVREFYGTEEEALRLISQENDLRRHDTESQRAWAVVGEWDELAAEAKKRQKASGLKNMKQLSTSGSKLGTTGEDPQNDAVPVVPSLEPLGNGPTSVGKVCEILADRVGVGKSTMNAARALDLRYRNMKEAIVAAEYEIGELEEEAGRLLKEIVYAEMDGRLEDAHELQQKRNRIEDRLSEMRKMIVEDQQEAHGIDDYIARGGSVNTLNNRLSAQPKTSRIPDKKKTIEAYDNLRRGARIIERSLNYMATCSGPECFVAEAKEILDLLVGVGRETLRYDPPQRFEVAPREVSTVVPSLEPPQTGESPVVPSLEPLGDEPQNDETPFVGDDDWMFQKMYEMDT